MRNVLLVEAPLSYVVNLLGQTEYHLQKHANLSTVEVLSRFHPVEDCTARAVSEATHIVVCAVSGIIVVEKVMATPVRPAETPVSTADTSYW